MDSSFVGVISLIVTVCGIYCIYAYFDMKKTGEINGTLLLGNNIPAYKCKDKEAYLKKTMPMVLLLGVVTTIYGLIDLVNNFLLPLGIVDAAAMIIFLIVLVVFVVITTKCKKEYFNL